MKTIGLIGGTSWISTIDYYRAINQQVNNNLGGLNAGADCLLICANTPHFVADAVQESIHIPLIQIASVTAAAIKKYGLKKIGLIGTKFTMEQNFFKDKLTQQQIETIIPGIEEREFIHHTVFYELGKGKFLPETKERYLTIINNLVEKGAKGIIFGCTEIPLLINANECPVPVFDTAALHARAAVDFALIDEQSKATNGNSLV
jgi:aspartate racemase